MGDRKKILKQLPSKNPQNQTLLSGDLNENLKRLQDIYADCSDVIFHDFLIGDQTKAVLIYIDGLTNVEEVDQHVLAPLLQDFALEHTLPNIRKKIAVSSIKPVQTFTDVIEEISNGNPVLLMNRENQGLSIGLSKWEKRSIEEPMAESVLRGPREGFIETLRTNTSLLRRKLRSPNLKIKSINIGTYSRTQIAIAYIEGIADPALVEEMTNRLQRIEIDGVLESAYIEELIEDNPYSPFPQLLSTERPDVASAYLLEGHVVVVVDGTPSVLIAPVTFFSLMQSPADYYERYFVGTAIRWLRYLFFSVSLLGPSLYVAVVTFHQEMIPGPLLQTMAKSRELIPFPALVEALLMETVFEALREAGARLPKQIGSAVSIVGALVIGQAAIAAGIVSAPMVMVVAITGIASFMAPRFTVGIAIRLLRFPMMFLAGFLGFLGLILGVIVILNHLLALRSFGVPYMSPLAPMKGRDMKDVLFRAPRWALNMRPHLSGEWNRYRQAPGQQPGPTKRDEDG
ncbi:spore germination protein [Effusibacillus lacus]|uniref:Spore germination protein n=1 Tax=Effusibacillus lacus TaxID=1348429 RepID=A0A292YS69_9BACL|nr:spore germination protein [Effusibacillus lacus]TCS75846.1 spore germination protein KA [Effusibacillus lacus]GAX91761.1 spore germination protein [Effusibacillus lacus]